MEGKGSIAVVMGTRPEGIKLCPLILKMKEAGLPSLVITSGQHTEMLAQVLSAFSVSADIALPPVLHGGRMEDLVSHLLQQIGERLRAFSPSLVIVQGDTATAFAAALAAFLLRIPVMHLEAGLRSGDPFSPFPEECFRRSISTVASLHIAPTPQAMRHLWQEGIAKKCIYLYGNTVEDALHLLSPESCAQKGELLLTVHRREHSERELRSIFSAVLLLMERYPSYSLLYPVHPTPRVRTIAEEMLGAVPRIHLVPPMPVPAFYRALASAPLVLTDSGGVQEEAALLGVRTLVLRNNTEREHELLRGNLCLGGTEVATILSAADALLSSPAPKRMESRNGSPSAQICKLLCSFIPIGFDKQRLFQGF